MMGLSVKEIYHQLTSIKVEETTFEDIVFFEEGKFLARVDFFLNALEGCSFFLDVNGKLHSIHYYYDEDAFGVHVYDDEQSFLRFDPIWQEYQKYHRLRLRLLFKRKGE